MQHDLPPSLIGTLYAEAKLLLKLHIEDLRLRVAEKLALVLAMAAFYAVVLSIGMVFIVFVSLAMGGLLATVMPPCAAYAILAALYVLAFALICLLRRRIFVDPITRFLSRLIVERHGCKGVDNELVSNDNDV